MQTTINSDCRRTEFSANFAQDIEVRCRAYQILCKTIQEKFCTWDHTIVSFFVKWQCGKEEQNVATTQLYCISILLAT